MTVITATDADCTKLAAQACALTGASGKALGSATGSAASGGWLDFDCADAIGGSNGC